MRVNRGAQCSYTYIYLAVPLLLRSRIDLEVLGVRFTVAGIGLD
jgi:hypothetical protein